ncbi:MptD family putative ECF transporter S component [Vallitalea sp.]|jgi:energy-coupling factor transport system substrate-specific component|uniref:MptD family putative ECF transporter S component n=1 Tax=Vallitalea sp. TaxID=1882829 RepID=UPI0025EBDEEE|nr:MptD family putative ECF transporter S component [Vallitalea sp.]MCT4686231.1 MptD family putative ECF transporter S component [Vallitalea sp.]
MSNLSTVSKQKLSIKDLVVTGIFSALFFVMTMIGGIFFAPNPVLTFLLPPAVALLTGPVYLLLIAKVPKHGPILILGILMGLLMFVTGMYWLWSVAYIVLAIVAELISGAGKFNNMKLNIMGFMIFSLNPIGSYMMLWINQNKYIDYLVGKGTEQSYMNIMVETAKDWMLPAMIIGTLLLAFISALLGKRLLKKQFEKAGIVA